jgi:hypothetical protein
VQYFYTGSPVAVNPFTATDAVLRVFPNPASDAIHVFVDSLQRSAGEIILQDMFGRTVLKHAYKGGIAELNASTLASGIYHVLYTAANGQDIRLQQRVLIAH